MRLLQLLLSILRVVGVEAEHRVPRWDAVVPVDDPDAARVIRLRERNQRRDRGRDAGAGVDAGEQTLLDEARVNPELGAQQVAQVDSHRPSIVRLSSGTAPATAAMLALRARPVLYRRPR